MTCSDVSVRLPPLRHPILLATPLGQRGERLREPVAVLVEVVALDLDRPGPDRRIGVVAVLAGEEPVLVVVDPGGLRSPAAAATAATAATVRGAVATLRA